MYKIGVIGAGTMAAELVRRLVKSGVPAERIIATHHDPLKAEQFRLKTGVCVALDNARVAQESGLLLLCVRPQQLDRVLEQVVTIRRPKEQIIISILAGISLASLAAAFGTTRIVHMHPTSLLLVTDSCAPGPSLWIPHQDFCGEDEEAAKILFSQALGRLQRITEPQIPEYVFITGNSPAYLIRIVQAFVKAVHVADSEVFYRTIIDALYTCLVTEGKSPQEVLEKIATTRGITQAGIDFLEDSLDIDSRAKELLAATVARLSVISTERE